MQFFSLDYNHVRTDEVAPVLDLFGASLSEDICAATCADTNTQLCCGPLLEVIWVGAGLGARLGGPSEMKCDGFNHDKCLWRAWRNGGLSSCSPLSGGKDA